jgi:hypothetical protein
MLESITDWLQNQAISVIIVSIAIVSIFKNKDETFSLLVFASLCGAFLLIAKALPHSADRFYYLLAAATDLIIIISISRIEKLTDMIIQIQEIAKYFIFANLFGWVIYELYFKPELYNNICLALFIATLIVSIQRGGYNALGYYRNNSHFCEFFGDHYNSSNAVQSDKIEERA